MIRYAALLLLCLGFCEVVEAQTINTYQILKYREIRGKLYPRFDEARCGEDLKAIVQTMYAQKKLDDDAWYGLQLRVTGLKDSGCVSQYFNVIPFSNAPASVKELPSVSELVPGVVVVRVPNFTWYDPLDEHKADLLADQLAYEVNKVAPWRIVLDLRGDTGGYVYIANAFLSKMFAPREGTIIDREVYANGSIVVQSATADGEVQCPNVIITDHNTASASEIVIGALKNWCPQVVLVGEHTFGKGVVNLMDQLPQGWVRYTTCEYFPDALSKPVDHVGFEPDFPIGEEYPNTLDKLVDNALAPRDEALDLAVQVARLFDLAHALLREAKNAALASAPNEPVLVRDAIRD